MGLISEKLRRKFSAKKKLIRIDEIHEIASQSDSLLETIKTPDRLKDFDPLHAIHITAQNIVSVIAERISIFPELKAYHKEMTRAEDLYIPGYPPISPVTHSFFTLWAFYDFCFGRDNETMASVILDVSDLLGMPADWAQVVRTQMQSRMGVYEHCGWSDEIILLKELAAGEEWKCKCPAGYRGSKGELWFVRIVGSPIPSFDYGIAFTTPYILRGRAKKEWLEFFERNGINDRDPEAAGKLNDFMRRGLSKSYWLEFIMNGYDGYQKEAIYLRGIPDLPRTLPHGGMYDD